MRRVDCPRCGRAVRKYRGAVRGPGVPELGQAASYAPGICECADVQAETEMRELIAMWLELAERDRPRWVSRLAAALATKREIELDDGLSDQEVRSRDRGQGEP